MGILRKTLPFVALMLAMTPEVLAADGDKAWPQRTVRLIVPVAAGGAIDVGARLYADRLSKKWSQPVVVENRPGAETNVGTAAFVNAHDDHTLLYGIGSTLTLNPLVYSNIPYDPARDLVPISATASVVIVVAVHNGVSARSLSNLASLARADPGKLLWGAAPGLPRHAFAAFLKRQGLDMLYVPYRDVATPQADLSEGRVHVLITSLQGANAPVQSGKAHIIAVANAYRASMLNNVPTATEAGYPELTVDSVSGLFGWRDIPGTLRDKISADVQAVAQDPEVRVRLEATGQLVLGSTPPEFMTAIEAQRARVVEIARLIDLKPNSK